MKTIVTILIIFILVGVSFSFSPKQKGYDAIYTADITAFKDQQEELIKKIASADLSSSVDKEKIIANIFLARLKLKGIDFWLRYFNPTAYKKINGPLPVEWETDPVDKTLKPERKEGSGLSLAQLYLGNDDINKDTLLRLIQSSSAALHYFETDTITKQLQTYQHFFLANRLFLLNLAAIYTTGFECPDTSRVIPELCSMLSDVKDIYKSYNASFAATNLPISYFDLYDKAINFTNNQPAIYSKFDHFTFIRDFVTPLFAMNQACIRSYAIVSKNGNDYTLNNNCNSIFDKSLYTAQNTKGVYAQIEDEKILDKIKEVGRLLFYDPLLSGNNKRSCASCHKSGEYFTDTAVLTAPQFDEKGNLPRNTPSLVNVIYNHLLMLDGKRTSLQNQAEGVMTSHVEMNSTKEEIVKKVMSCAEYKNTLTALLRYTPQSKEINFDHIISAITFYYGQFSQYTAPFDDAINQQATISNDAKAGFGLFMSKALCATCHFVPQFNGVKPPYIGSEFEVLGVPNDTAYKKLSDDKGRYDVNPAIETMHAFRTGSLRNIEYTKPYMHNGIFNTLDQVIDFYDAGGGAGKKLKVDNQTLGADSLHLNKTEKMQLLAFLHSLNEKIVFDEPPAQLPSSSNAALNNRRPGGLY